MKRTFFALCAGMMLLSFPARAISYWEGTAVASSYGEFPSAGLYAACSSFPRNSVIEVTNLDNSKTVQVLVTRSLDNPGVFIALSPEAAGQLMIQIGAVARVKVALPQTGMDNLLRYDSPGMSSDPDLNPQALVERERQKGDSGLPPIAATKAPEVAAAETKSPDQSFVKPPVEKPATEKPPVVTAPKANGKPDAISGQRQQPEGAPVAMKPKNLPDTPLAEKTPSAVEARTASPATDMKPEALALLSSSKDAGKKMVPPYALKSPELEGAKATAPEVAQVYEASILKGPAKANVAQNLAVPGLEARGKPESSSIARLKAPSGSSGMALVKLASPELEQKPGAIAEEKPAVEQKAEAFEIARKSAYEPSSLKLSSLDLPKVEEGSAETATAVERLVALKKPGPHVDANGIALADPELAKEEPANGNGELAAGEADNQELQDVDERLLASKRNPTEAAVALVDPEIAEQAKKEDGALVSADERLLASRKAPNAASDLALADPELGHPAEDANKLSSVEERLVAAKKNAPELSFGKVDPELERLMPAKAEEKVAPEALAALTEKPKAKVPSDSKLALAGPELAPEEKAVGPEIAAASRPGEPKEAHDLLAFDKANPEITPAEKPVEGTIFTPKAEEKPIVQIAQAEKKPETAPKARPEVVESFRKGAEALDALNALRMEYLSKGIYYVQVGVYRSGQSAAKAVSELSPDYPLSYQEVASKDNSLYRVYVGPLRKDESGVVMVRLKSMGIKDAFVRKGD
jgi:hypothetical protein